MRNDSGSGPILGDVVRPSLAIGWYHDVIDDPVVERDIDGFSLPVDQSYSGAMEIDFGIEIDLGEKASLWLTYEGVYGLLDNYVQHGGSGQLRYRF